MSAVCSMAQSTLSTLAAPSSDSSHVLSHQKANLLGLPLETRLCIYHHILRDIQNTRRVWNRTPKTRYDGIRLACKQLCLEATGALFSNFVTIPKLSKLLSMPVTRSTFDKMRSLYVQIDLDYDSHFFHELGATLESFQLSLQELHLFFKGHDSEGNEVNAESCAIRSQWKTFEYEPDLPESGQDFEKKLILLRTMTVLRSLRVLQIQNFNIPILQAAILSGKPHLQALSITCDPRSQSHNFSRWLHRKRDLFRGLLTPIKIFPLVHALEVDANAVVPVESAINHVAPTLRHFSWRVPNLDFQMQFHDSSRLSFYSITERLIQTLSWRAPTLGTLRLCIIMRSLPVRSAKYQRDLGSITSSLKQYLPNYTALKHLEIHYDGGDEFFRNHLIHSLPHGLQRLYISDATVSVHCLVTQVHRRYLQQPDIGACEGYGTPFMSAYYHGLLRETDNDCCASSDLPNVSEASWILVNLYGHVEYVPSKSFCDDETISNGAIILQRLLDTDIDYLDDHDMVGEDRLRTDDIPLNTGKLGFIVFEYDAATLNSEVGGVSDLCCEYTESNTTRILKLNGRLLDREHNHHLANAQMVAANYGIQPKTITYPGEDSIVEVDNQESGARSCWPAIHAGLHQIACLQHKEVYSKQIADELEKCFRGRPHWYFGNEKEAEMVFRCEPVAKPEDQKIKPLVKVTFPSTNTRCEWMSQDPVVSPVGSFPTPAIPHDWKDQI